MKTRIPYAVSNFEAIATGNYYYVDKTKFSGKIEEIRTPVFSSSF